MNFASLREYFYKLANRCYLLVLLPLAIFIYIYQQIESKRVTAFIQDEKLVDVAIIVLLSMAVINLTTVHWLSRKRLKKYAGEIGLGNKLDRYYEIVMLRLKGCCASSLMTAVGLLLTESPLFGIFFLLILAWTLLQWPSSRRACRDLQLKGDEYEMVYYKKDKF